MTKRLFTDFDGPIMDVSERYYRVYLDCIAQVRLPQQKVIPLTKAQFWQNKRAQVPELEIARQSGLVEAGQAQEFLRHRQQVIHTPAYFEYDQIMPTAIAALKQAQHHGIELGIMTMRRQRELEPVLHRYQLSQFFPPERRFCLRDDYVKTGDTLDKPLLMQKAIATLAPVEQQWIVGDTEADILAGKRYRVQTIAILSGIRDRPQLQLQQPDHILPDLASAISYILQAP
ncbi:MAG: HAD family hydrolase [Pseudanabaenaceae cyanobacterium bins.68]|nr:HAD family hydrolase [Pseudanabaenaceae cyanobacterium bins.68]